MNFQDLWVLIVPASDAHPWKVLTGDGSIVFFSGIIVRGLYSFDTTSERLSGVFTCSSAEAKPAFAVTKG